MIIFVLFSLIIWWIAVIEFLILNQSYIPWMNSIFDVLSFLHMTGFDLWIFVMNTNSSFCHASDTWISSPHFYYTTVPPSFPLPPLTHVMFPCTVPFLLYNLKCCEIQTFLLGLHLSFSLHSSIDLIHSHCPNMADGLLA